MLNFYLNRLYNMINFLGEFMKLIINYDLINKIKESNNGMKLQKNLLTELKIQGFVFTFRCAQDLMMFGKLHVFTNLLGCTIAFFPCVGMLNVMGKFFESDNKRRANMELILLSSQLKDINISTSLDLIKESEVYKTEYKIVKNNFNMPVVK